MQPLELSNAPRSTLPVVPVTFANPFDTSSLETGSSAFAPPDRKESTASINSTTLTQPLAESLARTPSMAASVYLAAYEVTLLTCTPRRQSAPLDLHFSREDMIDKFLFASVTGNGQSLDPPSTPLSTDELPCCR